MPRQDRGRRARLVVLVTPDELALLRSRAQAHEVPLGDGWRQTTLGEYVRFALGLPHAEPARLAYTGGTAIGGCETNKSVDR